MEVVSRVQILPCPVVHPVDILEPAGVVVIPVHVDQVRTDGPPVRRMSVLVAGNISWFPGTFQWLFPCQTAFTTEHDPLGHRQKVQEVFLLRCDGIRVVRVKCRLYTRFSISRLSINEHAPRLHTNSVKPVPWFSLYRTERQRPPWVTPNNVVGEFLHSAWHPAQ